MVSHGLVIYGPVDYKFVISEFINRGLVICRVECVFVNSVLVDSVLFELLH